MYPFPDSWLFSSLSVAVVSNGTTFLEVDSVSFVVEAVGVTASVTLFFVLISVVFTAADGVVAGLAVAVVDVIDVVEAEGCGALVVAVVGEGEPEVSAVF